MEIPIGAVHAVPGGPSTGLSRWDKIAGLALPLVAVDAQTWFMQDDVVGPWLVWGFATFGILALLGSTRVWASPISRSFLCGANFACAAGWLFTAADHAINSYFFIWLFAFGPFVLLPCASFSVNFRKALALFHLNGGLRRSHVAISALIVFSIPVAVQVAEAQWLRHSLAVLSRRDVDASIAALQGINSYPLRFGRFTSDVCDVLVIGGGPWISDDGLKRQTVMLFGPHPEHCLGRDPHT